MNKRIEAILHHHNHPNRKNHSSDRTIHPMTPILMSRSFNHFNSTEDYKSSDE
ncbi:MAG: hypothetical protein M9949_07140 [Candidatus Kapabacteria bacterium]|nr:hypothetical protein [Candidatus Kapabacteria bacterium]